MAKTGLNQEVVEEKTVKQLSDAIVFNSFNLSLLEKDLINYATNITIPMVMKHKGYENCYKPIKFNDSSLSEYATIFIKRFKSKIETDNKKFVVEIWHTTQIVGMFFKLIPISQYTKNIIWHNKKNSDLETLSLLTNISSDKLPDFI